MHPENGFILYIIGYFINLHSIFLRTSGFRCLFLIYMNMEQLEKIQNRIYEVRGVRVMLDRDLATLYGVTTGNLNKAVKRNIERFPERFMFQLTEQENLRFQNGIASWGDDVIFCLEKSVGNPDQYNDY